MKAIVVGLGGIGSNLLESLCRTLLFSKSELCPRSVLLVDGDRYQPKNRDRQRVGSLGNKAEVARNLMKATFPPLDISAEPEFISSKNIRKIIKNGDAVFSCVDNHATRKLISDHFQRLKNGLFISGGNEKIDGNIQICHKRGGAYLTPPITHLHPEIENPKDKNPADRNCGEMLEVDGDAQILAVNVMIAGMMLGAFTLYLRDGKTPYSEAFYDLEEGAMASVMRH